MVFSSHLSVYIGKAVPLKQGPPVPVCQMPVPFFIFFCKLHFKCLYKYYIIAFGPSKPKVLIFWPF